MGSGEYVLPRDAATFIDGDLNGGRELRNALDFVNHERSRMELEEPAIVGFGQFTRFRVLQICVSVVRKASPYKRRFSGLPRTGQGDHRKFAGPFPQRFRQSSFDHGVLRSMATRINDVFAICK